VARRLIQYAREFPCPVRADLGGIGPFGSSINHGIVFALFRDKVKVRITETPREPELDGIRLDKFVSGEVRDVSASIGAWLVAQGYAEPEMRHGGQTENQGFSKGATTPYDVAHDRRGRSSDR
jgi:hypothetical protein